MRGRGGQHQAAQQVEADVEGVLPLIAVLAVFVVLAAGFGYWAYAQGHEKGGVNAGGVRGRVAEEEAEVVGGGGARRGALARMRARRQAGGESDEEDEQFEDGPKVGKKKGAKLDAKEDRRANREAEEEARARKKEKQEKREEEDKEAADERRRKKVEEEEAALKALEEKKKSEEEEFEKWKDMFETADDGAQADEDLEESQGMLQEFIDYIKNKKIAALDEVASEFKLKSQEVVNRVEGLEAMGRLTGLLDDRGKFIYISLDEMKSVAKWINVQGRITVSDLAVESNRLIDLNPKEVVRVAPTAPIEDTL